MPTNKALVLSGRGHPFLNPLSSYFFFFLWVGEGRGGVELQTNIVSPEEPSP